MLCVCFYDIAWQQLVALIFKCSLWSSGNIRVYPRVISLRYFRFIGTSWVTSLNINARPASLEHPSEMVTLRHRIENF